MEDSPEAVESSVLIAYFSWAENAVLEEGVDAMTSPSVSDPGNVQQLAGWIQEETGGELFSIQVTDPYPSDWDACLERANEERGQGRPPRLGGAPGGKSGAVRHGVFWATPTGGTACPWLC